MLPSLLQDCFNTQPPEGGWLHLDISLYHLSVSTHSRPKAAGFVKNFFWPPEEMFQHTAARRRLDWQQGQDYLARSFNTQPPEGGWQYVEQAVQHLLVSTHSRPKAAGSKTCTFGSNGKFQHTAARRRLGRRRQK